MAAPPSVNRVLVLASSEVESGAADMTRGVGSSITATAVSGAALSDIASFAATHLAGGVLGQQTPAPQPAQPAQLSHVGPPPGWYQDKADVSMLRWWDGSTWTEVTQSKPPSA